MVAADRRAQRHHGGGTDFLETLGENGIGVDVGQDDKAFFYELFRREKGFNRVWQEVVGIRMNLELDPLG